MKELIKNKIEKIKTKVKDFLKDDFNNWYWRLVCLLLSLALAIAPVIYFIDLIYVGIKHADIVNAHFGRWLIVNLVVLVISVLSILLSKWMYKM